MKDIRSFGIDIPNHKILILHTHVNGEQLVFTKRSNIFFMYYRPDEMTKFKFIPLSTDHDIAYSEYQEAIEALNYPNFNIK